MKTHFHLRSRQTSMKNHLHLRIWGRQTSMKNKDVYCDDRIYENCENVFFHISWRNIKEIALQWQKTEMEKN